MQSDNEQAVNLKSITTFAPSYLKDFLHEDEELLLVYLEKNILQEDSFSAKELSRTDNNDSLEITGSPLEVDLKGDESLGSCTKAKPLYPWTEEESKHFPMSIKEARHFINHRMALKSCDEDSELPVYVVCDGDNSSGTVIIGAEKCPEYIVTAIVNIIGCFPKDHKIISMESMEKSHILNTRIKGCKIDYLVKYKYYLYGIFLHNIKYIYETEHFGSICIEVSCNDKCSLDAPQNFSNIKTMVLQIVAGHNMSSVNFLWEDLCLLQTFLDVLSDEHTCNDPKKVLSSVHIPTCDIYKSINDILSASLLKREAKINFELKHIRSENILDKLWNVLKLCEDLSALRDSLHYFFEELVEADVSIKIPENDNSSIAAIVDGIVNGKLAVPTLTFSQALEFLFELGAEKLKNDYQMIIKNFYSLSGAAISAKWSQLQNKLTLQDTHRKTRITVNLKSGKNDINHHVFKLAYLSKLHVATELIYLVKNEVFLPEDTFDNFCERVCKKYVDKDAATYSLTELQRSPLCTFSIVIDTPDKIINEETPVSWSMRMTSLVRNTEVTTLYHLSKYPIIPTNIFDKYDISNVVGEDAMSYYVCKMEMHKEFL